MVLVVETVRNIQNEVALVADTATYSGSYAAQDWTSVVAKSIHLDAQSVIGVKFDILNDGPTSSGYGAGRLVITDPIIAKHISWSSGNGGSQTVGVILQLAAGDYTFYFQVAAYSISSGHVAIKNIYIGVFDFTDDQYDSADSGNTVVTASSTGTLINESEVIPSARVTAVGTIRKNCCIVQVHAERVGNRGTVFKNPGASNDANRLNVTIWINDVQQTWTESQNDTVFDYGTNNTYGEGGTAKLAVDLSPDATHTVKVKVYNGYGADETSRVLVKIAICPWFCGSANEPVDFNFPQGSTLYYVAEPVYLNPSKTLNIGRVRGITWTSTVDYFKSNTGQNRISDNLLFDLVNPANCLLYLTGIGSSLTYIGVDRR
ncbi:hypothetical protein HY605_01840 [Candidatus Peregrinibacteria bacterium]|nr:hypothetical protein [Candidatus Peregrinibacteria bacterium]